VWGRHAATQKKKGLNHNGHNDHNEDRAYNYVRNKRLARNAIEARQSKKITRIGVSADGCIFLCHRRVRCDRCGSKTLLSQKNRMPAQGGHGGKDILIKAP
jgi:hypothetical protein